VLQGRLLPGVHISGRGAMEGRGDSGLDYATHMRYSML
jgi:hypothetical protein